MIIFYYTRANFITNPNYFKFSIIKPTYKNSKNNKTIQYPIYNSYISFYHFMSENPKSSKSCKFYLNKSNKLFAKDNHFKIKLSHIYLNSFLKNSFKEFSLKNNITIGDIEYHYKLLGMSKNQTKDEIKANYLKLAKLYHPDINSDESAKIKFQEIKHSYDILINYYENQENIKITFEEKNNKDIDNIITNIFSYKKNNSNSNKNKSNENENFNEKNILILKDEEMLLKQKKLLIAIKSTLNKNYDFMDVYDLENLKRKYKKNISKFEKAQKSKIFFEKTKNNLENEKNLEKLGYYENHKQNINHEQNNKNFIKENTIFSKILDKTININHLNKLKTLNLKIYEIIIKIICIYCVCSFIAYTYNKKVAYILAFYLIFMNITS